MTAPVLYTTDDMLTKLEKQSKIVDLHKQVVAQKNIYTQQSTKREYVLKKYTDGKFYGDCSSGVRKITEEADPSVKPMGGNTVAQYQNKKAVKIECKIVNGVPTDISALRVGHCLYFAGTDTSRAGADYVGHVEQIHSIVGNKVTLFGHGSGNPKFSEMVAYCKSRQNTKTNTKKGNRGLLKVLEFIKSDSSTNFPTYETTAKYVLGDRLLKNGSSGDDVKELQRYLKSLGFFNGSIGGNYLEITTSAVKAFQKKYGLTVDGMFGLDSYLALMELVNDEPAESTPAIKVLTTTGNVYMRVGPDASFDDEGIAKTGKKLSPLLDENGKFVVVNGWYAIIVNKVVLWVFGKYVKG